MADNSRSLRVKDAGASRTRGGQLRELVDPRRNRRLETLEDHFEVRRYLFDARLQSTKDFVNNVGVSPAQPHTAGGTERADSTLCG